MTLKKGKTRLILTIPEPMLKLLEKEKEKYMHDSVQELILESIRDKYLRYRSSGTTTKRGRPKKLDYDKALERKNVFTKEGGAIVEI